MPGRHYFISMFIIGAALFSTFSTVIYRHYDQSTRLNQWVFYNYELTRRVRLILVNLLNMETGVRGYLLSGDREFLDPYHESLAELPEQIKGLRDYQASQGDRNTDVAQWVSHINALQQLLGQEVRMRNKLSHGDIVHNLYQQKQQMDNLRGLIDHSIVTRMQLVREQMEQFHSQHRRFLFLLIAGTVLAISAMLVATLVILGLMARSKRASEEVELAEERFRTVMNGIGDGVYDLDPRSGTMHLSPAYYEMLGYEVNAFPHTLDSVKRLLHPEDTDEIFTTLARYSKHEIPAYKAVFRMLHKDGNWRWMLSRGIGFWDHAGRFTRFIGTHSDITEQKQREEELSQLNSELETYTFIASHDLRSPLVNLKGFAKELVVAIGDLTPVVKRVEPQLSEEERAVVERTFERDIPEAVDFILRSAERMDTLTTAVLDLSRIGKREYTRQRIEVSDIVRKCLDGQAYEISRNNITVTLDPLPRIITDPLALEQVFTNLIDNAIKYLDAARPGEIRITARETPSDVIFEVIDNGRGIAEADLPKVFEIFRRARNADNVRGQGMGMAFVRATVRKLGGNIWCHSTLGEGTIFFVRLPRIMQKEE